MNTFTLYFGCLPADTSVLQECSVVAVNQGRVAEVLCSISAWYANRERSQGCAVLFVICGSVMYLMNV